MFTSVYEELLLVNDPLPWKRQHFRDVVVTRQLRRNKSIQDINFTFINLSLLQLLLEKMTVCVCVCNSSVCYCTLVSEFQLIVPLFFIFQYLMNLVPGLRRDPSGRFSSSSSAVIAGTARGHGRLGRLRTKKYRYR